MIWVPVFAVGLVVWALAAYGAWRFCKGTDYPDAVILGDKVCVLKDYESAVFDIGGGRKLYVMRLPKEVKNMPVCQRGGK